MPSKSSEKNTPQPDRIPLTKLQAQRLAGLSGLKADALVEKSIAHLKETYPWGIDPIWLGFRRICGRVVTKDPATGTELPVPYATVHVEDTDCNLIAYFPQAYPWGWYFPFRCHREEIASVKTDSCGRFCVWVPRFDIDWILRWRRERICYPNIFIKPNLIDILKYVVEGKIPFPGPGPDPGPLMENLGPDVMKRVRDLVGDTVASRLNVLQANVAFGRNSTARDQFLSSPAFSQKMAPPLPPEFHPQASPDVDAKRAHTRVRNTLAARLHVDEAHLSEFQADRFVGPFWRCFDIFLPEWTTILDVPDITFRVTQDVNGDGVEENIYSESYFDVRWDDTSTSDVTLYASPWALTSTVCDAPVVPCGNAPEILFVGLMSLTNQPSPVDPYIDNTTGFARRPNRPHPSGDFVDLNPHPLATAPFCSTLQLYGCTRISKAAFYRVRYSTGGSPLLPFVGMTWPLNRGIGGPPWEIWPSSDPQGWYQVINPADNWFPPDLLLEWYTPAWSNGLYTLEVQVADAGKTILATSAQVSLFIDNSAPVAQFNALRWRFSGGSWNNLSLICPVIARGVTPQDIEVEVDYSVLANHLRSVALNQFGCGGGDMALQSALSTAQHWHTGPGDNSVVQTARYSLSHLSLPGSYGFSIDAASRAFNPAGGDAGHLVDWNYDPVYIHVTPQIDIAIVNA